MRVKWEQFNRAFTLLALRKYTENTLRKYNLPLQIGRLKETLLVKVPLNVIFSESVQEHRPARGFYEWQAKGPEDLRELAWGLMVGTLPRPVPAD